MRAAIKPLKLAGKALADVYAAYLGAKLGQARGKVWAHYERGGWIVARGESLAPHPDMLATYPNGWSMMHRIRSNQARAELRAAITL